MTARLATDQLTLRAQLARELCGDGVALAVRDTLCPQPSPCPEEAAGLSSRAVEKRKREFAAGRAAAREAMGALGHPAEAIPIGDKRAPIWPEPIVGSITHTQSCAMATVAWAKDYSGLGLDVEEDTPLKPDLWDAICSRSEQQWMDTQEDPGRMGKLIFSAKEAAYKCQYLVSERFYGFDGMELEIDTVTNRFLARFTAEQSPFAEGDEIAGRFAIGAGLIITAAELPRSVATEILERGR